jgi:hypothetical protein
MMLTADGQRREEMCDVTSFSPFAQPVHFPGHKNNANAGEHMNASIPSSCDISGEAGNEKGRWPLVDSLEQLHSVNYSNSSIAEVIGNQAGCCNKLRITVRDICTRILASLEADEAAELYYSGDGDEVLRALLPHYHAFLDQRHLDGNRPLFPVIYYGALECLVGAFL